MSIFRRLKNLWKLSEFEPINRMPIQLFDGQIQSLYKTPINNQATIVDLKEPEDIILEQNV